MFKDKLFEELALMFGESPVLHNTEQNSTNESIYISIGTYDARVTEDHSISFTVPFSVTIYADRNDFFFGYITTKSHAYRPNIDERLITTVDDYENMAWSEKGVVGVTKDFMFNYTTEYNLQTKKLKFNLE